MEDHAGQHTHYREHQRPVADRKVQGQRDHVDHQPLDQAPRDRRLDLEPREHGDEDRLKDQQEPEFQFDADVHGESLPQHAVRDRQRVLKYVIQNETRFTADEMNKVDISGISPKELE